MRVIANETENIDSVYLNGKRLITWIEADDKEGWVTIELPPANLAPPEMSNLKTNELGIYAGDIIKPEEWTEKKLTGEVEIAFKNLDLDDSGLES